MVIQNLHNYYNNNYIEIFIVSNSSSAQSFRQLRQGEERKHTNGYGS